MGKTRRTSVARCAFTSLVLAVILALLVSHQFSDSAKAGIRTTRLSGHTGTVSCAAFAPDGKTLATGGADGSVRLWSVETLHELKRNSRQLGRVISIAFDPRGQFLAFGGHFAEIDLWGFAKEVRSTNLRIPNRYQQAQSVAVSSTSSLLGAVVDRLDFDGLPRFHGTAVVWDLNTREEVGRFDAALKHQSFSGITFSPDGKTIGLATPTGIACVDVKTLHEISFFPLEAGSACMAFSPDGQRIASGGTVWQKSAQVAGPVVILDRLTGRELRTLEGHRAGVLSVAFSPDGRRLASGGYDGTLRLWDTSTGKDTARISGHDDTIHCVAFSPDGRLLVSCGNNGLVLLHDLSRLTEQSN